MDIVQFVKLEKKELEEQKKFIIEEEKIVILLECLVVR